MALSNSENREYSWSSLTCSRLFFANVNTNVATRPPQSALISIWSNSVEDALIRLDFVFVIVGIRISRNVIQIVNEMKNILMSYFTRQNWLNFFCAVVQSDIWNETRSSSTKVAARDPYCCVASPLQQATGWSVTVDYLTYLFLWSILYVKVNETYET